MTTILKNTTIAGTGHLTIPVGTTTQRPAVNTSIIRWTNTGSQSYSVLAGSTPTLTNTSWTAPAGVNQVEVLVVAGGGGAGFDGNGAAGGGGAGGLIYNSNFSVTPGTAYTVTVGAGGSAAGVANTTGSNGSNSVFGSLTAIGGGGSSVRAGSSSGGSSGGTGDGTNSNVWTVGSATAGQGFPGANTQLTLQGGGGGGGAGGPGSPGLSATGGGGGLGLNFSISGTPSWYAGGGGGAAYTSGHVVGMGGSGIGGNGGKLGTASTAGTASTGSGGGGGGSNNSSITGGAGGSGVVILRYNSLSDGTDTRALVRYNTDLRDVEMFEGPSIGWQAQDTARNLGGHNLITNSNLKGNDLSVEAIWTKTNNSTDVLAPDGSALTTKCVSGTSGNTFFWQTNSISYKTNTVYTESVWVRVASGSGTISFNNGVNANQVINPTTTWQRYSFTYTTTASAGPVYYLGFVSPSLSTTFYFWGWQLEEGVTSPGPYTVTTTAPSPTPTSIGNYRTHTYTTTGTSGFTPTVSGNVEVLVVAGGGGGGGLRHGAGGGGGGVVYKTYYPVISGRAYTVTVGAGGTAGTNVFSDPLSAGQNGGNSQFGTLIAIGGGGGGGAALGAGKSGGSGGGGSRATPGAHTVGQGNAGGNGGGNDNGCGGGGAGAPGGNYLSTTIATAGGAGLQFSISGTPTYYAGGGGGGGALWTSGTPGAGGLGGGGAGSTGENTPATAGTANTGGGGGGAGGTVAGSGYGGIGGAGGSGIVIVRYRYE